MRPLLARVMVTLTGLATSGCVEAFGTEDAHAPGDALGTFHVSAKTEANTCGDASVEGGQAWEFDVKLARDGATILWDNGAEIISGDIAADEVTFRFESGVLVDMRTEEDAYWLPPCSIERRDAAEGVLDSPGTDVTRFDGELAYDFAPTAGSDCQDLITGPAPIFLALPCAIAFDLQALRTEAPAP